MTDSQKEDVLVVVWVVCCLPPLVLTWSAQQRRRDGAGLLHGTPFSFLSLTQVRLSGGRGGVAENLRARDKRGLLVPLSEEEETDPEEASWKRNQNQSCREVSLRRLERGGWVRSSRPAGRPLPGRGWPGIDERCGQREAVSL